MMALIIYYLRLFRTHQYGVSITHSIGDLTGKIRSPYASPLKFKLKNNPTPNNGGGGPRGRGFGSCVAVPKWLHLRRTCWRRSGQALGAHVERHDSRAIIIVRMVMMHAYMAWYIHWPWCARCQEKSNLSPLIGHGRGPYPSRGAGGPGRPARSTAGANSDIRTTGTELLRNWTVHLDLVQEA